MNRLLLMSCVTAICFVFGNGNCFAQSNASAWLDNNGVLHIEGDGNGVQIEITVLSRGAFGVEGFDGFQTTVNGSTTLKKFIGVDSLDIQLGDGDDLVYVNGKDIYRAVDGSTSIATAAGDDHVGLKDFHVGSEMTISMSGASIKNQSDEDTFHASGCHGNGDFFLETGSGSDRVHFEASDISGPTSFAGIVTVDTGSGTNDPDIVTVYGVGGQIELTTSNADDEIEFANIVGQWPQRINSAGGDDTVVLRNVRMILSGFGLIGRSEVDLGSGDNSLTILDSSAEEDVRVRAGSGRDAVVVERCTINDLQVRLERGDDSLIVIDSSTDMCFLDGGQGKDNLYHSNTSFNGFPQYMNWESIREF